MLIVLIFSLPGLYFSLSGDGKYKSIKIVVFGYFEFTLETMTYANISLDYIKDSNNDTGRIIYIVLVICDLI